MKFKFVALIIFPFCVFMLSYFLIASVFAQEFTSICICKNKDYKYNFITRAECDQFCQDKGGIESFQQTRGSSTDTDNGVGADQTKSLTNPLCPDNDPDCVTVPLLIGRIISAILGVVGSIALAIFVYGGFLWMTSAGNSEQVNKGRETLIWATIGLAVIFAAYALVSFVIKAIGA